jgi:hypothetical protein
MKDIEYFSEFRMNKSRCVRDFRASLPTRLDTFLFDYDNDGKVLQGYRGPAHLCDGSSGDSQSVRSSDHEGDIQQVAYWYAISKWRLFTPVIFILTRLFEDTNWHYIYFDSNTGEALATNRNEAREIVNRRKREQQQERYTHWDWDLLIFYL